MASDLVEFFEIGTISLVIEQLGEEFGRRGEEDFKAFKASGITQGSGQE